MTTQFPKRPKKPATPRYRRKTRFWCPECGDLRRVSNVSLDLHLRPTITLECGHKRKEALPSKNPPPPKPPRLPWKGPSFRTRMRRLYNEQKGRSKAARRLKRYEANKPKGSIQGGEEIII